MSKQRIRGDVERHAQESIGRTLIKLAMKQRGRSPTVREAAVPLNLKLKQRMTWRQVDVIAFSWIPAAHNQTPRIRVRFDFLNQARNLIDAVRVGIVPAEGTPEVTVHGPKIAGLATKTLRVLCVSPFLPDVHAARAQILFVGVTRQKPEQLFRDPAKGNFLRRNNGKALAQIESRLKSEVGNCPDTGAVFMFGAVLEN